MSRGVEKRNKTVGLCAWVFEFHLIYKIIIILGMVIQPLIGDPYNRYIKPYYWVDDHFHIILGFVFVR